MRNGSQENAADKKIVAAFVRPRVSQETVETFDEEFAKGRDIGDTWVVHPTRSHGDCTSSFSSKSTIKSWSVNRWSQGVVRNSDDKVQICRLWILLLLCDTNWRPHASLLYGQPAYVSWRSMRSWEIRCPVMHRSSIMDWLYSTSSFKKGAMGTNPF